MPINRVKPPVQALIAATVDLFCDSFDQMDSDAAPPARDGTAFTPDLVLDNEFEASCIIAIRFGVLQDFEEYLFILGVTS